MPKFTERMTKKEGEKIEHVLFFMPPQNKFPKISFEDQVLIGVRS
jgi:hypothetical protein